jgi:hypothetical protein
MARSLWQYDRWQAHYPQKSGVDKVHTVELLNGVSEKTNVLFLRYTFGLKPVTAAATVYILHAH